MTRADTPLIYCDGEDGECGTWDLDYYAQAASSVDGIKITATRRAPGWVSDENTDLCPEHAPKEEEPARPIPRDPVWMPVVDTETGAHDKIEDVGRGAREITREEQEKFVAIWNEQDDIDLDNLPGYRFTLFHEVLIRFKWEEWFRFPDGVMESREAFEHDPIGFAIDAYLEPRHDDDITEVVKSETRVEYDPNEEAPPKDA